MSKPRELNREELKLLSDFPQLFQVNRVGSNSSKAGSKIYWTEEQCEFIIKDYQQNLDVKRLSLLFGTSEQTMREWLHKFGIKTLTRTEKNRLNNVRNSDYFEKIDTPDKAYWLGFLYADGGIYASNARWTIRINLKREDENHLKKFIHAIQDTKTTVKYTVKKDLNKEYEGAYICIGDKKMVCDLIDKGCTPQKSLTITFPKEDKVPHNLLNHFIRGYFDGDGCITYSIHKNSDLRYYSGNIIGTEDMLKGILKEIGKEKLKIQYLNKTNHTTRVINFSGNRLLSHLYDYMYKDSDSNIELDRKKNKFIELKKQRQTVKTYSNKDEYINT